MNMTYQNDNQNDNHIEWVRTTISLPKNELATAKITAILTATTFSMLVRIALKNEIKKIKGKTNENTKS